jgi:poly(beta-D-mannuronate) lyase
MSCRATVHTVNSLSALQTRINSAVAGDVIILQNGIYTNTSAISINRVANAASPILIRAQTTNGVEITGAHGFSLNSPAAYIIIQGFVFTHTSGRNSVANGATHCRFTRNIFQCTGEGAYLTIAGHDTEVDRNEFRNKSTVGNMIDVRGSGSQVARRVWIHHNHFHDFTSAGGNGAETLRFGLSGLSLSTGDGLIEHNLFIRCRGENELISNKSSGNTYRYNTFLESAGAQLTLRHGNDCLAYGNYFRQTDGLRVFGDRHLIFANYFERNTKGVDMGNGDGEVADGAALTSHDRPDNCIVAFNTFITNNVHYQMGGRTDGLGALNITVVNNLFQGSGNMASISGSAPYTGTWSGNIRWNNSNAGSMPTNGYTTANPLLMRDAYGVLRLQSGSPAIGAATGSHPLMTVDMNGQPRDADPDVGADEFSSAPFVGRILATNDVGPMSVLTSGSHPIFFKTEDLSETGIGALAFSGTNGISGATYFLLTSTNLYLPVMNWTRVATNIASSNGHFTFMAQLNSLHPGRFYRVEQQ